MKLGSVILFGVVFAPLYLMLAGWFLERPRNPRLALTGVGYLLAITIGMWLTGALLAAAMGLLFF